MASLASTLLLIALCWCQDTVDPAVPYNNITRVITCVPGIRANCASRYGESNTT